MYYPVLKKIQIHIQEFPFLCWGTSDFTPTSASLSPFRRGSKPDHLCVAGKKRQVLLEIRWDLNTKSRINLTKNLKLIGRRPNFIYKLMNFTYYIWLGTILRYDSADELLHCVNRLWSSKIWTCKLAKVRLLLMHVYLGWSRKRNKSWSFLGSSTKYIYSPWECWK